MMLVLTLFPLLFSEDISPVVSISSFLDNAPLWGTKFPTLDYIKSFSDKKYEVDLLEEDIDVVSPKIESLWNNNRSWIPDRVPEQFSINEAPRPQGYYSGTIRKDGYTLTVAMEVTSQEDGSSDADIRITIPQLMNLHCEKETISYDPQTNIDIRSWDARRSCLKRTFRQYNIRIDRIWYYAESNAIYLKISKKVFLWWRSVDLYLYSRNSQSDAEQYRDTYEENEHLLHPLFEEHSVQVTKEVEELWNNEEPWVQDRVPEEFQAFDGTNGPDGMYSGTIRKFGHTLTVSTTVSESKLDISIYIPKMMNMRCQEEIVTYHPIRNLLISSLEDDDGCLKKTLQEHAIRLDRIFYDSQHNTIYLKLSKKILFWWKSAEIYLYYSDIKTMGNNFFHEDDISGDNLPTTDAVDKPSGTDRLHNTEDSEFGSSNNEIPSTDSIAQLLDDADKKGEVIPMLQNAGNQSMERNKRSVLWKINIARWWRSGEDHPIEEYVRDNAKRQLPNGEYTGGAIKDGRYIKVTMKIMDGGSTADIYFDGPDFVVGDCKDESIRYDTPSNYFKFDGLEDSSSCITEVTDYYDIIIDRARFHSENDTIELRLNKKIMFFRENIDLVLFNWTPEMPFIGGAVFNSLPKQTGPQLLKWDGAWEQIAVAPILDGPQQVKDNLLGPQGKYFGQATKMGQTLDVHAQVVGGSFSIHIHAAGLLDISCKNQVMAYDSRTQKLLLPEIQEDGNCLKIKFEDYAVRLNSISYDPRVDAVTLDVAKKNIVGLE